MGREPPHSAGQTSLASQVRPYPTSSNTPAEASRAARRSDLSLEERDALEYGCAIDDDGNYWRRLRRTVVVEGSKILQSLGLLSTKEGQQSLSREQESEEEEAQPNQDHPFNQAEIQSPKDFDQKHERRNSLHTSPTKHVASSTNSPRLSFHHHKRARSSGFEEEERSKGDSNEVRRLKALLEESHRTHQQALTNSRYSQRSSDLSSVVQQPSIVNNYYVTLPSSRSYGAQPPEQLRYDRRPVEVPTPHWQPIVIVRGAAKAQPIDHSTKLPAPTPANTAGSKPGNTDATKPQIDVATPPPPPAPQISKSAPSFGFGAKASPANDLNAKLDLPTTEKAPTKVSEPPKPISFVEKTSIPTPPPPPASAAKPEVSAAKSAPAAGGFFKQGPPAKFDEDEGFASNADDDGDQQPSAAKPAAPKPAFSFGGSAPAVAPTPSAPAKNPFETKAPMATTAPTPSHPTSASAISSISKGDTASNPVGISASLASAPTVAPAKGFSFGVSSAAPSAKPTMETPALSFGASIAPTANPRTGGDFKTAEANIDRADAPKPAFSFGGGATAPAPTAPPKNPFEKLTSPVSPNNLFAFGSASAAPLASAATKAPVEATVSKPTDIAAAKPEVSAAKSAPAAGGFFKQGPPAKFDEDEGFASNADDDGDQQPSAAKPAAPKPAFSFGGSAPAVAPTPSAPAKNPFETKAPAAVPSGNPFTFGSTPTTAGSSFSFGAAPAVAKPSEPKPSAEFSFGAQINTAVAPPKTAFDFKPAAAPLAAEPAKGNVSFGSANPFSFGK